MISDFYESFTEMGVSTKRKQKEDCSDMIKKCFLHTDFGTFLTLNTNDNSDDVLDNLPLARLSSAEATVTDLETCEY